MANRQRRIWEKYVMVLVTQVNACLKTHRAKHLMFQPGGIGNFILKGLLAD